MREFFVIFMHQSEVLAQFTLCPVFTLNLLPAAGYFICQEDQSARSFLPGVKLPFLEILSVVDVSRKHDFISCCQETPSLKCKALIRKVFHESTC